MEPVKVEGAEYTRAYVRLRGEGMGDSTFEGMAEFASQRHALLLAVAEAYERLCFEKALACGLPLRRDKPFGIGVGFRRRSALLRAWGEYYERRLVSEHFAYAPATAFVQLPVQETTIDVNPVGRVYVTHGSFEGGHFGSGYGLNKAQARDSARRSAARSRDFPQRNPRFTIPDGPATLMDLTPIEPRQAWLQCVLVGHAK